MRIVVLEGVSVGRDMSWDGLRRFGEVEVYDSVPQNEVKEKIKAADIIIVNKLTIDESVLEKSSVNMVCVSATGYNNIDIEYCKQQGICVTNVGGYSTDSVAQHTLALLLSVYEKLSYYNAYVKSGAYCASKRFSNIDNYFHEVAGKTWGIVGLGAIGRAVARLAEAFGANVIYYSASGNTYDVNYEGVNFDTLLKQSDIISLHCPLHAKTKGLFDKEAFQKMKRSAVLINVARGPVVSEMALAKALAEHEIMAAGLDVFEQEPISADNPLLGVEDNNRLVMTPHIGWGTVEARNRLMKEMEANIEAFLRGEKRNVVV